nr:hypothetical protein [Tanacetum cinerariifolium]
MLVAKELEEQGDAEEQGNDNNAAEEPATAVDDVEDQSIPSPNDTIMKDVSNQGRMIDELDKDEGAVLMNENEENEEKYKKQWKRRRGVVIRDLEEESSAKTPTKTKSKDKGKGIMVEEPKPLKKKQQVELDEAYARKLHKELNQDIDLEIAMDHVKQKAKENPYMEEEEDNIAIASINETPAQKAAKRRRLNEEAKDVEALKQHLEIVSDEDDDVYTKATPLARKAPIVDYQIVHFNNKPHYKIIYADADYACRKKIPTLEVYIGSDAEYSTAKSGRTE